MITSHEIRMLLLHFLDKSARGRLCKNDSQEITANGTDTWCCCPSVSTMSSSTCISYWNHYKIVRRGWENIYIYLLIFSVGELGTFPREVSWVIRGRVLIQGNTMLPTSLFKCKAQCSHFHNFVDLIQESIYIFSFIAYFSLLCVSFSFDMYIY